VRFTSPVTAINEYDTESGSICIPPTLLISAMAVTGDVNRTVSMDCKQAGDLIYIVGTTFNELGGSHYFDIHGFTGNNIPKVDAGRGLKLMNALSKATAKSLVRACHDCSEGGIGVAAAEMAFAGGLGMALDLTDVPLGEAIERDDYILFSESNSRFIVEVSPADAKKFEHAIKGVTCAAIGKVTKDKKFKVKGREGKILLSASIKKLKEAWQQPLRW